MEKRGVGMFLKNLLSDERGQSTTEYILILSVVVMIAVKFKEQISKRLETLVGKVGGKIESAVDEY
ncbi:MAG: Flp1 family type IVb pilin [Bdellovibrionota bacterium]